MRHAYGVLLLALAGGAFMVAAECRGQQVTVQSPFNTVTDSFFERFNTSWNFNWKGAQFNFGGPNVANPQFGGFNPDAGINGGFAIRGGGFNGAFNFGAAQGSNRIMSTQTPVLTLMNGQTGFVSDTSQSPFVVSYIPVVGSFPGIPVLNPAIPQTFGAMNQVLLDNAPAPGNHRVQAMRQKIAQRDESGDPAERTAQALANAPPRPNRTKPKKADAEAEAAVPAAAAAPAAGRPDAKLAAAQASSAGRAAPSVAEARRMHEAQQKTDNGEVLALMERARTAEEAGKPNVAKIYYKMAVQRASGDLKQQAQDRLDALTTSPAQ